MCLTCFLKIQAGRFRPAALKFSSKQFFENHFHEIQPLVLKSLNIPIQLDQLSDTEMQNLLFAWWQVNKHFFLRSAFRLLRTMTQTPSDGQTSSNALSATDIQAQT